MTHHGDGEPRRTLARAGTLSVEQCACGTVHLHLGGVSLRMEPHAFDAFCETMVRALVALKVGEDASRAFAPGPSSA
jgi:hypothetical protein